MQTAQDVPYDPRRGGKGKEGANGTGIGNQLLFAFKAWFRREHDSVGASLVAQLVKNPSAMQEAPRFDS